MNAYFRQSHYNKASIAGLVILYLGFLTWLFWPTLNIYFAGDDWVLLYYVRNIDPSNLLNYFSPRTIWFYRPLQTLQYGLTYHYCGLNPVAYNIQLMLMYSSVPFFAAVFLRQLFGWRIAVLSALLFSVSVVAPDVLLWKASYNTLQYVIVALCACTSFSKYLLTQAGKWYLVTAAFVLLSFLTKESCVQLPLLFFAVYFAICLEENSIWDQDGKAAISAIFHEGLRSIRLIAPFAAMVALYLLWHHIYFVNVESLNKMEYYFAPVAFMPFNMLEMLTNALIPFVGPNAIFHSGFRYRVYSPNYLHYVSFMPIVLFLFGVARRNIPILFGLIFGAATQIPTCMLTNYTRGRFAYFTGIAGCLVLVALIDSICFRNSVSLHRKPNRNIVFFSIYAALFVFSAVTLRQKLNVVQKNSSEFTKLFLPIAELGKSLPKQSVIRMDNVPGDFFLMGQGATEAMRIIDQREDIGVVALDGKSSRTYTRYAEQWWDTWSNAYLFDFKNPSAGLVTVRTNAKPQMPIRE